MITQAGAVKVMDFGIARAVADNSATVTQTANVIGTAQYLSPEQARGETVDARSDVYSTGCLLYELVTGVPPFQGDSPVAVAYQHVRENASAVLARARPAARARLDRHEGAREEPAQPLPERRRDAQRSAARAGQPAGLGRSGDDRRRAHAVHRADAAAAGRSFRSATPTRPTTTANAATRSSGSRSSSRCCSSSVSARSSLSSGSNGDSAKKIVVPNLVGLTARPTRTRQLGNSANCSATNDCKVYLVAEHRLADHARAVRRQSAPPPKESSICKVTDQAGQKVPANADVTEGSSVYYRCTRRTSSPSRPSIGSIVLRTRATRLHRPT